jgi:dienelactone hydrolase
MPRRPKAKPSRSHEEATVEGLCANPAFAAESLNSTREWRKVAVLGYCLGGLIVFLTAVRYRVHAAVAYHGGQRRAANRRPPPVTMPALQNVV